MKPKKYRQATVRIRTDQYSELLKIASEQQIKKGTPVTVGMLVREMIDKGIKK